MRSVLPSVPTTRNHERDTEKMLAAESGDGVVLSILQVADTLRQLASHVSSVAFAMDNEKRGPMAISHRGDHIAVLQTIEKLIAPCAMRHDDDHDAMLADLRKRFAPKKASKARKAKR